VGAGQLSRRAGGAEEELAGGRLQVRPGVLEFKIKAFGLKVNIYKHNISTYKTYACPDHS
jgi:hypothetical protein